MSIKKIAKFICASHLGALLYCHFDELRKRIKKKSGASQQKKKVLHASCIIYDIDYFLIYSTVLKFLLGGCWLTGDKGGRGCSM